MVIHIKFNSVMLHVHFRMHHYMVSNHLITLHMHDDDGQYGGTR